MNVWPRPLRAWSATPAGRKALRYLLVSALNVVTGEAVLGLSYLLLHWSAERAAVVAVTVATIPAYFLNRIWVWGRSGRSQLLKEVVPFWALALVYAVLSVEAAREAETIAKSMTTSRTLQTLIIMGSILVASAVLWLIRYLVLDTLVFRGRRRVDPLAPKAANARL